jgi:hypothetical protein
MLFSISYRVAHDEDRNNPGATEKNLKIAAAAAAANPPAPIHFLGPNDLESTLGYQAPKRNKRSMAVAKVEELVNQGALPQEFTEAMNFIYFGTLVEPSAA